MRAGSREGRPSGPSAGLGVACLLGVALAPAALGAQPRQGCALSWEPTSPTTRSVSTREGPDAHITHVSGGMLWTCGTATMEADSAVKYDLAARVELIGNVRYRDTIRTLRSRLLTYFEREDRVVARDSVRLTRIADGSTLTGPRVEFLRAVSGIDERTIATGRPHMTLYPAADDPGPPFEVDSDDAVFAGEEEARAVGDVVIVRPDLRAEADSALFRSEEGVGVLRGSPRVEAEGIVLRGDTIRFRSEEGELRDVTTTGRGRAIGESFDVEAERIDVRVRAERVELVWAHGPGRSVATSGDHRLYGDSLRFALAEGRIDTIISVGEAAAVRVTDGETARPDTVGAPAGDPGETADSAAIGTRDTVPIPASDTAIAATRDTVGMLVTDTMAAVADAARVPGRDAAAATAEAPRDSAASPDSAGRPAEGGSDAGPAAPEPRPTLTLEADASWVTGDTLYAIFEKAPADSAAADSAAAAGGAPPDSLAPGGEAPDAVAAPSDSAARAAAGPSIAATPADTAAGPRLARLIVVGNARSFYARVRDTTRTARPSRSYMIGRRIEIHFEEGSPRRVEGVEAIGLYLEPSEVVQGGAAPPAGPSVVPDSLPVRRDTTAVADSVPPRDTTAVADPAPAPGDTSAVGDSVRAGRDASRTSRGSLRKAGDPPPRDVAPPGRHARREG